MGSYLSDRVVYLPGCYKSRTRSFVQLTQVYDTPAWDMTSHRSLFNGSVRLFQSIWSQLVTGWLCCSLRWGRGFIRMGEISSVCRYNIVLTFSKYTSITRHTCPMQCPQMSPLEWTRCDVLKDTMLTAGLEEPTVGCYQLGYLTTMLLHLEKNVK